MSCDDRRVVHYGLNSPLLVIHHKNYLKIGKFTQSLSYVQLFATHRMKLITLFCPWDFPDENDRAVHHFLLQRIFLTQGLNSHLLHWQADSLPLSHLGRLLFRQYPVKKKKRTTSSTEGGTTTGIGYWKNMPWVGTNNMFVILGQPLAKGGLKTWCPPIFHFPF